MREDTLDFELVDVFAAGAYSGNPLPVVFGGAALDAVQLLRIAQEFRQFETAFLTPTASPQKWRARIFDLVEELPFAGHPLLGAAAVLHARGGAPRSRVEFLLGERSVPVEVESDAHGAVAWLDAGAPVVLGPRVEERGRIAAAFSLGPDDLHADLPIQALSTGLRYLVVPVRSAALGRARIEHDITPLVRACNADYAVLIDPLGLEQRHWNNDGKLEDFATGSAASVVAAYLAQQSVIATDEVVTLRQGRFAGRERALRVRVDGLDASRHHVHVGGLVVPIGAGVLRALPI